MELVINDPFIQEELFIFFSFLLKIEWSQAIYDGKSKFYEISTETQ